MRKILLLFILIYFFFSPAPSHSSATTNEDQGTTNCNQSDISNSSLGNASSPSTQSSKKDRVSKKLLKELAPCKAILEDLECHDDAWPFLLPVNTKQFPTYKKIIKTPMDLSTIKKKLYDVRFVIFMIIFEMVEVTFFLVINLKRNFAWMSGRFSIIAKYLTKTIVQ